MEKTNVPNGYNFGGGLKKENKPNWIKKRKLIHGSIFKFPTKASLEYVCDLSSFKKVVPSGFNKRVMSWIVPKVKAPLYVEQIGVETLKDGQVLPLLVLTDVQPKKKK